MAVALHLQQAFKYTSYVCNEKYVVIVAVIVKTTALLVVALLIVLEIY